MPAASAPNPGPAEFPERTKGEIYEGIGFQFCKIATVTLLAGRFALPVAAGCCAVFYALALAKGKRDTRCVLRHPWILIVLWGTVSLASFAVILFPSLPEKVLGAFR